MKSIFAAGLRALAAVAGVRRKQQPDPQSDVGVMGGFGIHMTEEETERERAKNNDFLNMLEDAIVKSGHFRPEKIPALMKKFRDTTHPFGRHQADVAFRGTSYLSPDEKRKLGLNTRMKYSHEFIDYFLPQSFKLIEPKSFISLMHLNTFHSACRKHDLIKCREMGFVQRVKILPDPDCAYQRKFKRSYKIDEAPTLPMKGCNGICSCLYQPIVSDKF